MIIVKLNLKPADVKTVRLIVRSRGGARQHASLTLPPDIVRRYDLKDKDEIVVAYVCKADENPEEVE
jgi:hypothetical protein